MGATRKDIQAARRIIGRGPGWVICERARRLICGTVFVRGRTRQVLQSLRREAAQSAKRPARSIKKKCERLLQRHYTCVRYHIRTSGNNGAPFAASAAPGNGRAPAAPDQVLCTRFRPPIDRQRALRSFDTPEDKRPPGDHAPPGEESSRLTSPGLSSKWAAHSGFQSGETFKGHQ